MNLVLAVGWFVKRHLKLRLGSDSGKNHTLV